MKKAASIPFEFVLEQLFSVDPRIKPMFGCHAIYVGEKIMLILRNKKGSHEEDNGIWISTKSEHHADLKKIFPSMRTIYLLGNGITQWQNLPAEADDFEENAMKVCELILKKDPRIGNVPKARRPKGSKKKEVKKKR